MMELLSQSTNLRITPCWQFSSTYSIYLQDSTISGGGLLYQRAGDEPWHVTRGLLTHLNLYLRTMERNYQEHVFSKCILYDCIPHCNVVVKALCYKPEGRGFDTR
jgi:hypothetical protein